jgi:hypothetical protein
VKDGLGDDGGQLLAAARAIEPELTRFLKDQEFSRVWTRLQENTSNDDTLHAQFHRWFDGLRTLKLIHHLREHGYPEQNMLDSIVRLLESVGLPWDGSTPVDPIDALGSQDSLLQHLRQSCV